MNKLYKRKKLGKKGFTLVELLVVIAIIGILAAVISPNAFKAIEKSKIAGIESDYKAIKTAVLNYYSDTGLWPATGAAGVDPGLITNVGSVAGWNGPYLERWPSKTPFGGTYTFTNANGAGDAGTPPGAAAGHSYKYIALGGINDNTRVRLEADLDGGTADNDSGIVRYDATFDGDLYIIISEQ